MTLNQPSKANARRSSRTMAYAMPVSFAPMAVVLTAAFVASPGPNATASSAGAVSAYGPAAVSRAPSAPSTAPAPASEKLTAAPAANAAGRLANGRTPPTAAAATAAKPLDGGRLNVATDHSLMVALDHPARTVFVANPDVADVQVNDHQHIAVFGRKVGSTSLYITTRSGEVTAYEVTVGRAAAEVEAGVRAQSPRADVRVTAAPGGLAVTGAVQTPQEAAAVKAAVHQFAGDKDTVNFNVAVDGQTQVNLQVRIVEVSKSVTNTMGFNWNALNNNGSIAFGFATGRNILSGGMGSFTRSADLNVPDSVGFGFRSPGGHANINAVVDALQTQGLISILAEPNLTAVSGETASFLAGGEFPVPVAQMNQALTVEWKRFGVALDFTPTVLSPGRISIRVAPEVSEISDRGAVTINNIRVPGIVVRRAQTTVELASGESFAIGGLFQNNISSTVSRFPWLGDVPVLGALFRSSSFTHDQSELVIIVTPYLVRPTSRTAALSTPADGLVFANPLEQAVEGKLANKSAAPAERATASATSRPHLAGPAGFVLEDQR